MHFQNPILFLLCSLGVFNGFLLSLYFLFFHKVKRTQNLFLGLLLLMLSLRIGKSLYSIFTPREDRDILILQIGLSACFLIGLSLFYYLKSSVENRKSIPKSWLVHFFILAVIVIGVGIAKPYKTNIPFWTQYFVHFIYATWAFYILLSGIVLRNILKKIFTKSMKTTTAELWLVAVFIANLLIYLAYIIGFFYFYMVGTLTFSFVFYALIFFLLFKKNRETIFQDIPEKYGSKKIDDQEASYLLVKLKTIMTKEELYKKPDVKLKDIASELHIIPHKLSQLLNDNVGKSFAQFVNEYKIEEAKKLIKENNQFTLEAIGYEAGFSSKSSFYATFKKVVGKTPSEYKKDFKV